MQGHRFGRRAMLGVGLWVVVAVLIVGGLPSVTARTAAPATSPASSLLVSVTINPATPTQGSQFMISAQVSGGPGPYTFVWFNLPPGCQAQPSQSWPCTISQPGSYSVNVTVSNNSGGQGNGSQTFTVTSSGGNGNGGGGNGNGNGNGSNDNSSNGFNLSSFGPILIYGLIAGIIVFALLIALTVGVIMIALTLSRRLPRIPRHGVVCGSCHATAPPGSKFCPACAAPLPPPT